MALQYAILEHSVNGEAHFDLLLEVEGQERLRTLQLARWPLKPGESAACRELPPHRRDYLTYEGEISGGRGNVRRVEAGVWHDDDEGCIVLRQQEPHLSDEALAKSEAHGASVQGYPPPGAARLRLRPPAEVIAREA